MRRTGRQQIGEAELPDEPGVYLLYASVDDEQPLYVGKADSLRRRWQRQHLGKRSGTSALRRSLALHLGLIEEKLRRPARHYPPDVEEALSAYLRDCFLELHTTASGDEAAALEHRLVAERKPLLNLRR